MAGANAGAIVAVEVFVEENKVAPVRVILEQFNPSIEGAAAIWSALENRNQAFLEFQ
jgi:hypothetical protein